MRSLAITLFYRIIMRIAHRFNWHYAPPIYPEGDTQLWCKWCGFRMTVPVAHRLCKTTSERIATRSLAIMLLCLIPFVAVAQTPAPTPTPSLPSNIYAAGFSYNPAGSPKVAGDVLYAHLLSDGGTYSFTFVDILPLKGQPSAVSTSVSTGLAQKVLTLGKAHAFVASGIGIQTDGKNTGWDWNGGVAIDYPIKNGWGVMPTVRFDKGSATEGYGYRFIASVLVRFGK